MAGGDNDGEKWSVQWNDLTITEQFKSGSAAIEYKRQKEATGLVQLQKYFGVRVAHKGFVTCIQ